MQHATHRGETLVEFALSLTVFLMTILGAMEFGILVFRYNMLSNLAQEGARRGSVCGKYTAYTGGLASQCNIAAFVRDRSLGIVPSASDVSVTWSAGSAASSNAGDTVTVSISRPFAPLTRIVPLGNITISASSQMVVSR
jgi:Flp pilus assembly protein TadG